jgi:hypothetical protein
MDESVVEYQARTLLGDAHLRVNSELTPETDVYDDLDETSRSNIEALKRLGQKWFAEFGDRAVALLRRSG